jgi:hypothetical protein
MPGFRLTSAAYPALAQPDVVLVAVRDVERPPRTVEKDFGGFERVRLIKILAGFVAGQAIPAVKVQELPGGSSRYGLRDGYHRFHASVAAGFDHIPTIVTMYLPD